MKPTKNRHYQIHVVKTICLHRPQPRSMEKRFEDDENVSRYVNVHSLEIKKSLNIALNHAQRGNILKML